MPRGQWLPKGLCYPGVHSRKNHSETAVRSSHAGEPNRISCIDLEYDLPRPSQLSVPSRLLPTHVDWSATFSDIDHTAVVSSCGGTRARKTRLSEGMIASHVPADELEPEPK